MVLCKETCLDIKTNAMTLDISTSPSLFLLLGIDAHLRLLCGCFRGRCSCREIKNFNIFLFPNPLRSIVSERTPATKFR